jgi:TfoX/Sxy family transcriptional regulator of competence genes
MPEERSMAYDQATAERVRRVLARRKGIAERSLMGGLAFMADDVMCCSVSGRGGLLVRVIPQTRETLLREPHAEAADMRGRQMTGFIRVQAEGYRTEPSLKKWVDRGLAAAAARPSKPKKAAASKKARAAKRKGA